jgi:hypothetical protein
MPKKKMKKPPLVARIIAGQPYSGTGVLAALGAREHLPKYPKISAFSRQAGPRSGLGRPQHYPRVRSGRGNVNEPITPPGFLKSGGHGLASVVDPGRSSLMVSNVASVVGHPPPLPGPSLYATLSGASGKGGEAFKLSKWGPNSKVDMYRPLQTFRNPISEEPYLNTLIATVLHGFDKAMGIRRKPPNWPKMPNRMDLPKAKQTKPKQSSVHMYLENIPRS